jgi:hypothetical protein
LFSENPGIVADLSVGYRTENFYLRLTAQLPRS